VTFIVVGTVAIFVIISILLRGYSVAGN
jgi:hypothetical protein